MKQGIFIVYVKFVILIIGIIASYATIKVGLRDDNKATNATGQEKTNTLGLGILAAGSFIAFAMIDNNDVREANKD